jgi:hypothetical protein
MAVGVGAAAIVAVVFSCSDDVSFSATMVSDSGSIVSRLLSGFTGSLIGVPDISFAFVAALATSFFLAMSLSIISWYMVCWSSQSRSSIVTCLFKIFRSWLLVSMGLSWTEVGVSGFAGSEVSGCGVDFGALADGALVLSGGGERLRLPAAGVSVTSCRSAGLTFSGMLLLGGGEHWGSRLSGSSLTGLPTRGGLLPRRWAVTVRRDWAGDVALGLSVVVLRSGSLLLLRVDEFGSSSTSLGSLILPKTCDLLEGFASGSVGSWLLL